MCCTLRRYVVQNELSEYLFPFSLLWIQYCAILYDMMMKVMTMVRMMMVMMMMIKCGKNYGSLKNKIHYLNWSQCSKAS